MRDDRFVFRHKPHLVHGDWRYHLPKRVARSLTGRDRVTYMLWEDSFSFQELIELDKHTVEKEIEGIVRATGSRSDWRYRLAPFEERIRSGRAVVGAKARSLVSRASDD